MNIIAYHEDSIPTDMGIEDVLEIYYTTKILLYKGHKPYILDSNNLDEDKITIIHKDECLK